MSTNSPERAFPAGGAARGRGGVSQSSARPGVHPCLCCRPCSAENKTLKGHCVSTGGDEACRGRTEAGTPRQTVSLELSAQLGRPGLSVAFAAPKCCLPQDL